MPIRGTIKHGGFDDVQRPIPSERRLARAIEAICYDVDRRITGLSEIDARLWARSNSRRHARTIVEILRFRSERGRNGLRILNASGLAAGHQDFSIAMFLRDHVGCAYKWTAYERPGSPVAANEVFQRYVHDLGLGIVFRDLNDADDAFHDEGDESVDVVLFTEIAEHIDHSTLLRALAAIRRKLRPDGIVIITTPNLVNMFYRVALLFGKDDCPYWGDELRHLEQGEYGHVAAFGPARLSRILASAGFRVRKRSTFSFGYGPRGHNLLVRGLLQLAMWSSRLGSNLGQAVLLIAEPGPPVRGTAHEHNRSAL